MVESTLITNAVTLPEPPPIDRKNVLMCLVDRFHHVSRSQVEALANVLYADAKQNRLRPLAEVCMEVPTLAMTHTVAILGDLVLQKTALSYTPEEMERTYSSLVVDDEPDPPSEADAFAGSGPARPLIKALYSLDSTGQILVTRTAFSQHQQDAFWITNQGMALAEAFRAIYAHIDWYRHGYPLIVAGKRSVDTQFISH